MIFPVTGRSESRRFQSLDGQWEIIFDVRNEGRWKQWQRQKNVSAHLAKREIAVPSCWETIEKDYEGARHNVRRDQKARLLKALKAFLNAL